MKTIFILFLFLLLYLILSTGLCFGIIGKTNPFHKFSISKDDWDGSSQIIIKTVDDKYFFFILFITWPFLLIFYYIPKGIYKILKFLVEFFAWSIVKLFKL